MTISSINSMCHLNEVIHSEVSNSNDQQYLSVSNIGMALCRVINEWEPANTLPSSNITFLKHTQIQISSGSVSV